MGRGLSASAGYLSPWLDVSAGGESAGVVDALRVISSLSGSPTSPHFVAVESSSQPGAGTRSALVLVDASRGGITVSRLAEHDSVVAPRWHPSRDVVAAVVDGHITGYDVTGRLIHCTRSPAAAPITDMTCLEESCLLAVVEEAGGHSSLWLVDVYRRNWAKVIDMPGRCVAVEASLDGRWVAVVVAEPGQPADAAPSWLSVLDLKTGRQHGLLNDVDAVQNPRWSPDGRALAAAVRYPGPAHWSDNWRIAITSIHGTVRYVGDVETNYGRNLPGTMALAWRGTELLATAPHRGAFRLWRIAPAPVVALSSADVHVVDFAVAAGGLTAMVETWPDLPPRLAVHNRLGAAVGTHRPNDRLRQRVAPTSVARINVACGRWQPEAFVLRPSSDLGRHSYVVDLHGGPHGSHPNPAPAAWQLWAALAGAGHTIVLPNPRGSSGYGIDFQRAVVGDWAGVDAEDVLTLVDLVVTVDGRRAPVGIVGWSYGAYLAAWLMATTDRFTAGVLGGVISDLDRFATSTDIPAYARHELGGAAAPRRSPRSRVRRGMGTMLLLHAEGDRRCPVDQATALHEALLADGNTAELVLYPTSEHVFLSEHLVADRIRRTRDWLRSHVRI